MTPSSPHADSGLVLRMASMNSRGNGVPSPLMPAAFGACARPVMGSHSSSVSLSTSGGDSTLVQYALLMRPTFCGSTCTTPVAGSRVGCTSGARLHIWRLRVSFLRWYSLLLPFLRASSMSAITVALALRSSAARPAAAATPETLVAARSAMVVGEVAMKSARSWCCRRAVQVVL